MSMAWVAFVIGAGLLVGRVALIAATFLPGSLERQWRQEASDFLGLEPQGADCGGAGVGEPERRRAASLPGFTPVTGGGLNRGAFAWAGAEWGMALFAVAALFYFPHPLQALSVLFLAGGLLAASIIDARHMILPDTIVQPLIWLGLALNSLGLFTTLDSALYGAMAGYLSLWSLYQAHKLLTGKEGMGYGDFKLFAALGAWAGLEMLPLAGFVAATLGVLVQLGLRLGRALRNEERAAAEYPFGPYLALAFLVCLFAGDSVVRWWLAQF